MQHLIELPPALSERLLQHEAALPQIIEKGLAWHEAMQQTPLETEVQHLLETLGNAKATDILALKPSEDMQIRFKHLLEMQKQQGLSLQQSIELEQYLLLEHLLRLAKGRAVKEVS
jgi:hypothetical protein